MEDIFRLQITEEPSNLFNVFVGYNVDGHKHYIIAKS